MPDYLARRRSLASHISGQCDCACPDGTYPEQVAPAPLIAYLEITPACTNRCIGCPNGPTFHQVLERPGILRLSQWSFILNQMLPHLQRVKLTGGEPTLHCDFSEIVALLDDMAMPFDLFTNGRWQDPERLVRLLSETRHFGGCLISLHGPTADSHEAFNGVPGSFEETVRNIRLAAFQGIPVVLSTIITQKNYALVDDLLALGEELGVLHIVFNRYVGLPVLGISPTSFQLTEAMCHVDRRRTEGYQVKFSVCIPQCLMPSSSQGCLAGIAACTIDPWGNMRPCNHAPLIVGNLLRQELGGLWHSESMAWWRERSEECSGCHMFFRCRGGCRAQAMLTGSEYDPLMMKGACQSSVVQFDAWDIRTSSFAQEVQDVCRYPCPF